MSRTFRKEQWMAKARRHTAWGASWRAELAGLEAKMDRAKDVGTIERIIARIDMIKKRDALLKGVMTRHVERATPDLLPDVLSALRYNVYRRWADLTGRDRKLSG